MNPIFQIENLDHLPQTLRKSAKAACGPGGTMRDLDRITTYLDNASPEMARYLLPVFYAILDPTLIPADETLHSDLESLPPATVLVIYRVAIAFRTFHLSILLEVARDVALELWYRAWPWIQFFHLYFGQLHVPEVPAHIQHEMPVTLLGVMGTLAHDSGTFKKMLGTPGSLAIPARAWKYLQGTQDPAILELATHSIVKFFADKTLGAQSHRFLEVIEGVGGSLDELARLVVLTLNTVRLKFGVWQQAAGIFCLTLRFIKIFDPTLQDINPIDRNSSLSDFIHCLLARGFIRILLKDIEFLTGRSSGMINEGLSQAFWILTIIFTVPSGNLWLPLAIRYRFIHSLLQISQNSTQIELVDTVVESWARSGLPPLLIRHKVLTAINDVLPDIRKLSSTSAFRGGKAFSKWKDFFTLLDKRLAVFNDFNSGKYRPSKMCANIKCGEIRARREFKRCSGCQTFYYCSPACQAVDWNEGGHKNACAAHRLAYLKERSMDFTPRERSFLCAVVDSDLADLKSTIILRQLGFMKRMPGIDFITVYYYDRGAAAISVDAVDSVQTTRAELVGPESAWYDTIRRARASGGRIALDAVWLSSGGKLWLWSLPLHTDRPTREGLRRIASTLPNNAEDWLVNEVALRYEPLLDRAFHA